MYQHIIYFPAPVRECDITCLEPFLVVGMIRQDGVMIFPTPYSVQNIVPSSTLPFSLPGSGLPLARAGTQAYHVNKLVWVVGVVVATAAVSPPEVQLWLDALLPRPVATAMVRGTTGAAMRYDGLYGPEFWYAVRIADNGSTNDQTSGFLVLSADIGELIGKALADIEALADYRFIPGFV